MLSDLEWWFVRRLIHFDTFTYNVRRSWALVRASWAHCDSDYSAIAELLRWQIHRTREAIERNDIVVSAPRHCRQMLIAETLLTRLLDGDYYKIADSRYPNRGLAWAHMVTDIERQDMDMLARYLRHLNEWWD